MTHVDAHGLPGGPGAAPRPRRAAAVVRPSRGRGRRPDHHRRRTPRSRGSGPWCPPAWRSPCPTGTSALVHPRSGLASRAGLSIVNAPGTVDAGYRGEIKVVLVNLDPREPIVLRRGDRIAQLVVQRVEQARFVEVDELPGSARGEGGHGSTGGFAHGEPDPDRRPDCERRSMRRRRKNEVDAPTTSVTARRRRTTARPRPGPPTAPTGRGTSTRALGRGGHRPHRPRQPARQGRPGGRGPAPGRRGLPAGHGGHAGRRGRRAGAAALRRAPQRGHVGRPAPAAGRRRRPPRRHRHRGRGPFGPALQMVLHRHRRRGRRGDPAVGGVGHRADRAGCCGSPPSGGPPTSTPRRARSSGCCARSSWSGAPARCRPGTRCRCSCRRRPAGPPTPREARSRPAGRP